MFRGRREPEQPLSVEESQRILSNPPNNVVLGAFDESRLIGMVSMGWLGVNATLFGLFVIPNYRRRQVAKTLIKALSFEAAKVSCRNLKLEVLQQNAAAIALYESMGFLRTSTDSEDSQFILSL